MASCEVRPTAFQRILAAAKAELAAARAKQLARQRDCKFEAEALTRPQLATP
jgi:hypothetical protein